VVFPIINYLVINKLWFTKKRVYLLFLLTTISVYPLYGVVTNMFPTLVSIRYEEGSRDKSFGLRLYLNNALSEDYKKGTVVQKAFGKGNEYSRNFVKDLFKFDIFPHNDFLRILTDWGLLGVLIFMYLLYLFAIKNTDSLYISLIYILLFYSNMVFNIFIISLLIIFYFNNNNLLIENGTQK
jgi:O-antigen ligase